MATLSEQLAAISKQYGGNSGGGAMLANGQSMATILKSEGKILYDLVQQEIDNYYLSYTPEFYNRSYNFKNSLRVSGVENNGVLLSIRVYFDEDMATHDSIFGGEDGYLPILYTYGWKWKDISKAPYRVSHYEGFDIIGKAVKKYNATNKYGIIIQVHSEWQGSIVEDTTY